MNVCMYVCICLINIFIYMLISDMLLRYERSGTRSRYRDSLRVGRSSDRMPVGDEIFRPVQTGSETHPAPSVMSSESSPGAKRPESGADHSPPFSSLLRLVGSVLSPLLST